MLLIFLIKLAHNYPWRTMQVMFAVADATLRDNFHHFLGVFAKHIVPRLFYLEDGPTLTARMQQRFRDNRPDLWFAADATLFPTFATDHVINQHLAFNSYKSKHGFHVVLREFSDLFVSSMPQISDISPPAVVSRDRRIQARSTVFGGATAEVTSIVKDSRLLECLESMFGIVPAPRFTHFLFFLDRIEVQSERCGRAPRASYTLRHCY
jgi:hypothetical protein